MFPPRTPLENSLHEKFFLNIFYTFKPHRDLARGLGAIFQRMLIPSCKTKFSLIIVRELENYFKFLYIFVPELLPSLKKLFLGFVTKREHKFLAKFYAYSFSRFFYLPVRENCLCQR